MNVQVEELPNCITSLRVEVPAEKVAETRAKIVKEFAGQAKLPGYRPGKAPQQIIERKFQKQIQDELQERLLNESTRTAISEQKLRVLSVQNVDDVETSADHAMSFRATLVVAPKFDLPDYKGIVVTPMPAEASDADVDRTLNDLRERFADFVDVADRGLEMGDFAVLDYKGTIDGVGVSEVAQKAGKMLSENEGFWLKLTPESFFPGFSEKLVGAKIEEQREVEIEAPADFGIADLAGKKIQYAVTIKGIKTQTLPEVNDELAGKIAAGKTLPELRELIKTELDKQRSAESESDKRQQIMTHLLASIECELPQNLVRSETQRMLEQLVRENQSRGITEEALKENEKELVNVAAQSARERLKGTFILLRIAEQEKITVSRVELQQRVSQLAARHQMKVDKLVKELEKNNAFDQIHEEVLTGKALDFLVSNASVHSTNS